MVGDLCSELTEHINEDVSETAGSSLIVSGNMYRKTVEVISQTLAWMLPVLQSSAQPPTEIADAEISLTRLESVHRRGARPGETAGLRRWFLAAR